jgi:hypothetical protein
MFMKAKMGKCGGRGRGWDYFSAGYVYSDKDMRPARPNARIILVNPFSRTEVSG